MRLFRRCLTEVCHNDMLTILAPFEGHKIRDCAGLCVYMYMGAQWNAWIRRGNRKADAETRATSRCCAFINTYKYKYMCANKNTIQINVICVIFLYGHVAEIQIYVHQVNTNTDDGSWICFLSSLFSSQELTFEHLQLQLHDVSWLDARLAPLLLFLLILLPSLPAVILPSWGSWGDSRGADFTLVYTLAGEIWKEGHKCKTIIKNGNTKRIWKRFSNKLEIEASDNGGKFTLFLSNMISMPF